MPSASSVEAVEARTPEPARIWQQALHEVRLQISPEEFHTWFRGTALRGCDAATCVIEVENPFNVDWLNQRCKGMVRRTLQSLVGGPVDVEFVVAPRELPRTAPPPLMLAAPPAEPARRTRAPRAQPKDDRPSVLPRYTFGTFVVGESNRLAHAACWAAAERPGDAYNPLFIYGGVGLGKTHLLHAIGHATADRGDRTIYVSSETFMNDFIESIRRSRMEDFRARYRQADVLLVDDVQFIAGREQTQEEFFHTFNAVYQAGGQIVLTSDRSPRAIATLEERLRSRFICGLMADIQAPELETRMAILRARADAMQADVQITEEALEVIARKVPTNVRELEGALNCAAARARLLGRGLTRELAAIALKESLAARPRSAASPAAVIDAVCRRTGVSREELEGKHRDRRVVVPRQIAMFLLHQETDLSLAQIGVYFGGRDHTTVLHSCEKIAAEIQRDEHRRAIVQAVRGSLAQG